jgi:hypothetical protein
MIGAAVMLPLIATAIVAALSPSARAALRAMPMPLLVGLNVWRVGAGSSCCSRSPAGSADRFRSRPGGAIAGQIFAQ